jgi:hypothetical protein
MVDTLIPIYVRDSTNITNKYCNTMNKCTFNVFTALILAAASAAAAASPPPPPTADNLTNTATIPKSATDETETRALRGGLGGQFWTRNYRSDPA